MSLHQKLVRLLDDVNKPAVSNTLALPDRRTNHFFAKNKEKKEMERSDLPAVPGQLIVTLTF